MRGFLSILAVSLILIGAGSVLTAPAATETHALDLSYEVQDVPTNAAAPAATQEAIVPDVLLASAGCCANGCCPYAPRVETRKVEREQTETVTTTETACSECNERSRRHPVVGAVCGAGKAVRGIFGHDRRAARRAARRGG